MKKLDFNEIDFDQSLYVDWVSHDDLVDYAEDLWTDYKDYYEESPEKFQNMTHERADQMVNIYTYDLWKDAYKYRFFTEDAVNEYGIPSWKDFSLEKILMWWEYKFYETIANDLFNFLQDNYDE